jgi:hypothetical protein
MRAFLRKKTVATIGTLTLALQAKTDKLESDLSRARQKIGLLEKTIKQLSPSTAGVERQMSQSVQRMAASVGGLQGMATKATAAVNGLVAAAAAFGAVRLVQHALSSADALEDMASQVNVSVESLQKLRFAAAQSGASADLLDRSLNVLNERLGDAATGSKESQQAFADLGLDWRQLREAGTEEAFLAIADALRQFPDVADRAARMGAVLGERSRAMANAMMLGSEGIREMGARLEAMGAVLSQEMITRLSAANKSLETTATVINAKVAIAVADLAPKIETTVDSLLRMTGALTGNTEAWSRLTGLESLIVGFFTTVGKGAASVITSLEMVARDIGTLFGALSTAAPTTLQGVNREITLLKQNLEVLARQPAAGAAQSIARMEAQLQSLLALREKLSPMPFAWGGLLEGPEARNMPGRPQRPTVAKPFTIDTSAQDTHKKMLEALHQEALRAAGTFGTWQQAIASLEQEIRQLAPLTPIVKDLDEAAKKASVTYASWEAAIQGLEQEIRTMDMTAGDWGAAIERANTAVRNAIEETRGGLIDFGESLESEFQTPIDRLRDLQARLQETLVVMGESFQPTFDRSMRAAQMEFARTTVVGQGLTIVAQGITDAFEQSFQGIVQGTLTVKEAFRNMATSIAASISKILVQKGVEALLGVALSVIGGAATAGVGGGGSTSAPTLGPVLQKQHGGLIPGSRSAPPDSVLSRLSPGEFVVRREAVAALGVRALERINALPGFQHGGMVPPVAVLPGMRAQAQTSNSVHIHNIVVKNEQEAQAKRQELEALDNHFVNVINKQILGGDGTLLNRSLRMVHGGGR